jgi:hypothetical protein
MEGMLEKGNSADNKCSQQREAISIGLETKWIRRKGKAVKGHKRLQGERKQTH